MDRVCENCGGPLPNQHHKRRFCKDWCRRSKRYGGACRDCGIPTSGSNGPGKAADRCVACTSAHAAETDSRKYWTRERVIEAIQYWKELYGEPPASADWNSWHARHKLDDEERAARFERGSWRWPGHNIVIRRFGSWNKAIRAAGFTPRSPNGGGGNGARRGKRFSRAGTYL